MTLALLLVAALTPTEPPRGEPFGPFALHMTEDEVETAELVERTKHGFKARVPFGEIWADCALHMNAGFVTEIGCAVHTHRDPKAAGQLKRSLMERFDQPGETGGRFPTTMSIPRPGRAPKSTRGPSLVARVPFRCRPTFKSGSYPREIPLTPSPRSDRTSLMSP